MCVLTHTHGVGFAYYTNLHCSNSERCQHEALRTRIVLVLMHIHPCEPRTRARILGALWDSRTRAHMLTFVRLLRRRHFMLLPVRRLSCRAGQKWRGVFFARTRLSKTCKSSKVSPCVLWCARVRALPGLSPIRAN